MIVVPNGSECVEEVAEPAKSRLPWPWIAGGGVAMVLLLVGLGLWLVAGINKQPEPSGPPQVAAGLMKPATPAISEPKKAVDTKPKPSPGKPTNPETPRDPAIPVEPEPAANYEIDMVTFIKAFAEGKADQYKGFLVRGGGAFSSCGTEGDGAFATVRVCGKRPDGTFYPIAETPGGKNNFDTFKDRLFGVKLVWLTIPPGYKDKGSFIFSPDGPLKLCQRFQARFHGEYVEATISQKGQPAREDKLPVLVWEAEGSTK
jgi:hypothetical protein